MTRIPTNIADQYVQKVMDLIHAPENDRMRIKADLQSHLQEGMADGEDMTALVERMGDPRVVAAEFMTAVPMVYAGFWRRMAAFLVDLVVLIVIAGTAAILAISLANTVPQHPVTLLENMVGGAQILFVLITSNGCIAAALAYFPVLEGRFGQTPGKRLFGLRVLSEEGLPITYWQAFLRRLSLYLEVLPLETLFVPFHPKRQRWFDILAKTVVVREK